MGGGAAPPKHLACRQSCSAPVVLVNVRMRGKLCWQIWHEVSTICRQVVVPKMHGSKGDSRVVAPEQQCFL